MAAAAYTPMGASMYGIGSMSAMGGTYTGIGGRMSGPRRVPSPGDGWGSWLDGFEGQSGVENIDGVLYFDYETLKAWFEEAQKNGEFPGLTWDLFLKKFFDPSPDYAFPVGEPWALLILALGYVGYMLVRRARTRARGI